MTIKLDMKTIVTNARKAYDTCELQAQQTYLNGAVRTLACTYSSPCAIGVSIPIRLRNQLDRYPASDVTSLAYDGILKFENEIEIADAAVLQIAHDVWHTSYSLENYKANEKAFVEILERMQVKYVN